MKNSKLSLCLKLFLTFFKIGAVTFGGGYAMISFIQRETTEKHKWVTEKEILDVVAIAESTPGPIAVNASTFVGYKTAGFFGAFCATAGIVLPAFVVILIVSTLLREFASYRVVKYAFFGIRAGVIALIVKALYSFIKQCEKTYFAAFIAIAAFLIIAIFGVSVPFIIIGSAICGLIYCFAVAKQGGAKL